MTYDKLKATDKMLVNRNGKSYQASVADVKSGNKLKDNDLFLVNRGANSYRISKADLESEIGSDVTAKPTVQAAVLDQNQTNANRFTSNSFTTTVTATESPTKLQMKAEVVGALTIEAGSSPIVANTYDGTGGVPLTLESDPSSDFSAGDAVEANTTYTPTSSEIVSVSTPTSYTFRQIVGLQSINNSNTKWDNGTDNQTVVYGNLVSTSDSSTYQLVKFDTALNLFYETKSSGLQYVGFWKSHDGNTWTLDSSWPTSVPGKVGTSKAASLYWLINKDPDPANVINPGLIPSATDVFNDSAWYVASDVVTNLEFTDETDLNLFQAGDVIGEFGTILKSVIAESATGTVYNSNSVGDMVNNSIAQGNTTRTSAATNKDWDSQLHTQIADTPACYTFNPPLELKSNESLWIWYVHQNNGDSQWIGGVNSATTVGPKNFGATSNNGYVMIAKGPRTIDNVWGLRIGNTTAITDLIVAANSSYDIGYGVKSSDISSTFNLPQQYFTSVYPGGEIEVISTDPNNSKMVVSGGEWGGYNTSQTWSSLCSGAYYSTYSPVLAFDGNLTTAWIGLNNGSENMVVDFSSNPLQVDNSLIVVAGGVGGAIYINGIYSQDVPDTDGTPASAETIKCNFTGTLTTFELRRRVANVGSPYFYQLSVDGKALIDGPWNQSQVWSQLFSLINPDTNRYVETGPEEGFNGSFSDWIDVYNGSTEGIICQLPTTITGVNRIEFSGGPNAAGGDTIEVSGVGLSTITTANMCPTRTTLYDGLAGVDVQNLQFKVNGTNNFRFQGLWVNGELLVDKGIGGDTEVTTNSPKRGKGTIESITGTAVVIDFTDNCFRPTQWLTKTGPVLVTPKAGPIASSTATTVTFDGPEGLLNFANGDAVTMCDADGNAASVTYESSEIIDVEVVSSTTHTVLLENWNSPANGLDGMASRCGSMNDVTGKITFTPPIPNVTKIVAVTRIFTETNEFTINGTTTVTNAQTQGDTNGLAVWTGGTIALSEYTQVVGGNSDDFRTLTITTSDGKEEAFVCTNVTSSQDTATGTYTRTTDSPQTLLTFENNTNLDKFPDGTVVQGGLFWANTYNTLSGPIGTTTAYDVNSYATWANSVSKFTGTVDYFFKDVAGLTLDLTQAGFQYWTSNDGTNWTREANTTTRVFTFPTPYAMVGGSFVSPGLTYSAVTVTDDSDIGNNKLTVSGGTWNTGSGSQISKTFSGTGTVDTVNAPNNQITLTGSNNQWVDGYYMKGPTKNAVEMKAYLKFDQYGQQVDLLPYDPGFVQMASVTVPQLTFPAKFSTDNTPDMELKYPTYLQTTVQAGNAIGWSDSYPSNIFYPQTSTYSVPVNSSRVMTEEFGEFCKMVTTADYRAAKCRVEEGQQKAEGLREAAEARMQDYLNQ